MNQKKKQYLLLDSRAGISSAKHEIDDVNVCIGDDWGRFILYVGSRKSVCRFANNNILGNNCVVSSLDGIIQWDMLNLETLTWN